MARIAHFTDVHITEDPKRIPWSALLSKRLIGWLNLRLGGRYAELADAERITEAMLRDLETLDVDHILFTGDVTGLSLPSEFERARRVLEPLLGDERVTGIPGNHDVYVRSAARDRLWERSFGEWERTDLSREDFPDRLRASYPYPLVRFVGENVAIVCLRDVRPVAFWDSSGRVSREQLEALEFVLAMDAVRHRRKILALHYGLRRADGSKDGYFHRLCNAEDVIRIATAGGVELVLHGHLHGRFVLERGAADVDFAIANPGALAYRGRAMAYHVYTLGDEAALEIETRRYDSGSGCFGCGG